MRLCYLRNITLDKTKAQHTALHAKASPDKNPYHHVPWLGSGDCAAHLQNHAGQQPEEGTNAVLALIVGGDSNIHVPHWRVGVTERDHGDVSQRCLHDRL